MDKVEFDLRNRMHKTLIMWMEAKKREPKKSSKIPIEKALAVFLSEMRKIN